MKRLAHINLITDAELLAKCRSWRQEGDLTGYNRGYLAGTMQTQEEVLADEVDRAQTINVSMN